MIGDHAYCPPVEICQTCGVRKRNHPPYRGENFREPPPKKKLTFEQEYKLQTGKEWRP